MKLLDPVAIPQDSAGNPQAFSIGLPSEQRPSWVKLSNQSPWAQGVRISGFADWLDAYTADVYPVPADGFEIDLQPRSIFVPQPLVLSASILPVLAYAGERFPGQYPMALPRQAASFGGQQRLDQVAAPAGQVVNGRVVIVPLGIQSIGFDSEAAKPANVLITGPNTGLDYLDELSPLPAPYVAPFSPTEDTQLQLVVDNSGGTATAVVSMIAYTSLFSYRPPQAPPASPWQAAISPPVSISAVIANGADLVLVAPQAGRNLYPFGCSIGVDAVVASALFLQDDQGNIKHAFEVGALVANPYLGFGAPWGVGRGAKLHNATGSSLTVRGSFVYSQL